jgi:hypothetical protein
MYMPGAYCATWPAPFVKACCTPGYSCRQDANDGGSFKCLLDQAATADYTFANATGRCSNLVPVSDQCGEWANASNDPHKWWLQLQPQQQRQQAIRGTLHGCRSMP